MEFDDNDEVGNLVDNASAEQSTLLLVQQSI